MSQRTSSFKRVWIWLVALLCVTAMAFLAAPNMQKALAADYEPVAEGWTQNKDMEPVTDKYAHFQRLDEHTVKVWGEFEWSSGFGGVMCRPDRLEIWRLDDVSNFDTVRMPVSVEVGDWGSAKIEFTDDKLIPGKQDYRYGIVGLKDEDHTFAWTAWFNPVGGVTYSAYNLRATKINDNEARVYFSAPGKFMNRTTATIYAGKKKVKTISPKADKDYKIVVKGKGLGKAKFKVVTKLTDDRTALPMSSKNVKGKANVWKSSSKASLNDCFGLTEGARVMKVYYKGNKMYADVWFFNNWKFTSHKLSATVTVDINHKVVGKKKVSIGTLAPKSSKWVKGVYLTNKTYDLVHNDYRAVSPA